MILCSLSKMEMNAKFKDDTAKKNEYIKEEVEIRKLGLFNANFLTIRNSSTLTQSDSVTV